MIKRLILIITLSLTSLILACCQSKVKSLKHEYSYNDQLRDGYNELTTKKWHDFNDNEKKEFLIKAKQAKQIGFRVKPTNPIESPILNREEIQSAYELLEAIKMSYGDIFLPKATAAAQISYECWLNSIKNNTNSKEGDYCRNDFYKITNSIIKNLEDIENTKGSMIIRSDIHFNPNSFNIDLKQKEKLTEFANNVKYLNPIKIIVDGHSDTVGEKNYNLQLSKERARKVVSLLKEKGINPKLIIQRNYGSEMPLFESGLNQYDIRNRTVRIMAITSFKD